MQKDSNQIFQNSLFQGKSFAESLGLSDLILLNKDETFTRDGL